MKFQIEEQSLSGLLTIKPRYFEDHRGYFSETYNLQGLSQLGFNFAMSQDNESRSKKNVLRGLHYQWDGPMGKLVRVVKGSVMDVCVDIRSDSKTYGQWDSFMLTEENRTQLWVPPGFAHAILSLHDDTIVVYKCSSVYNQEGESGINPYDSDLNIDWPVDKADIILSDKDRVAKSFSDYSLDPKF
jgi:dTDP-4-dehydrorhamnose 3,5-epimerase